MEKEPITVRGLEKLKEELIFLKEKKRPEIVAAIAEARSHGDLKENAEYHAAKERQSHNEGRIQEVEDIIARANVIDVSKLVSKKLIDLKKYFEKFEKPIFPLKSRDLLDKYKVKEGKDFGQKIKLLENIWLNNSFKLSKKEIDNVFGN